MRSSVGWRRRESEQVPLMLSNVAMRVANGAARSAPTAHGATWSAAPKGWCLLANGADTPHYGAMDQILRLGDVRIEQGLISGLCQRYQVHELSLFGSVARGVAHPDSDIDLLVEFLPGAAVDLVDFNSLTMELSQTLGRKVDLVSKNGLRPMIRDAVLAEARPLYTA